MKPVEKIFEFLGWLLIVSGMTFFASVIAGVAYIIYPTELMELVAIAVISIGFISGSIWATLIWIKQGTIAWLSDLRWIP
jgi:hypothetical protein